MHLHFIPSYSSAHSLYFYLYLCTDAKYCHAHLHLTQPCPSLLACMCIGAAQIRKTTADRIYACTYSVSYIVKNKYSRY